MQPSGIRIRLTIEDADLDDCKNGGFGNCFLCSLLQVRNVKRMSTLYILISYYDHVFIVLETKLISHLKQQ